MAHVRARQRKDGSVFHQVTFRHDGRQTSRSFDTAKDAHRWARLLDQAGPDVALSMLDQRTATDVPTLAEWLEHHLQHASGITDGTRGEYRRLADRSWLPALGAFPVDLVSKDQVRRWVREYAEGKSAKTVANAHGLLSTVLASAVEAGHRPDNPAKKAGLPSGVRTEMVFLTQNEFTRLLAAFPETWQPFVLTAATTGMRWGELTALTWRDVDLDARVPVIRVTQAWKRGEHGGKAIGAPKTRRSRRSVSLPAMTVRTLDPLRDAPDALVFRASRGGPIHHQAWLPRVWWPAVEKSKIGKRPRFHDLRHSHASWLLDANTPPQVVQLRLGHESIKTTVDTYGHLMPGAHTQSAAVLDVALAGAMPELEA